VIVNCSCSKADEASCDLSFHSGGNVLLGE
jgi:hypothetical protein